MKTQDVAKLSPVDRFLYWIRERHQIYLRRKAGKPKPWTDDEVLRACFFTNPYRENDKTTVWFRKNVRDPLRNNPRVLMATVIFRWFNYIPAGERLLHWSSAGQTRFGLLGRWDERCARSTLRAQEGKVFTGAFMIAPRCRLNESKLSAVCRLVDNVWRTRKGLVDRISCCDTLEQAHEHLTQFEGLGGFMAYETVCDLRYTYLLEETTDTLTWCNPGPGCIRGLLRLRGASIAGSKSLPKPPDWQQQMYKLLQTTQHRLPKMPKFEMREIEHSLCEFDKYERVRLGQGRSKRKYQGK